LTYIFGVIFEGRGLLLDIFGVIFERRGLFLDVFGVTFEGRGLFIDVFGGHRSLKGEAFFLVHYRSCLTKGNWESIPLSNSDGHFVRDPPFRYRNCVYEFVPLMSIFNILSGSSCMK
jgi:hypothetical protein